MPDAPASTPAASKKKKDKKKASKGGGGGGGSNIFDQFSQKQVAEFKEGFQFMDRDKDGVIGKGDIRATADEVGVSLSEQQIDQMISDCPAQINFTQLINMFGTRQQGGATDEDEVIIAAFQAFADTEGRIECESLSEALTTYGEKYTEADMKNFFSLVAIEDGKFNAKYVSDMLTGKLKED